LINNEIAVVIPAFNEEKALSDVIGQLDEYFSRDQMFLANDGSTDNTALIATQLGIQIISGSVNRGKGYILRKAFQRIISDNQKFRWILTFDADGQHDSRDIPHFLKKSLKMPNTGIILGKRHYSQMPFINRISNLLTSKWCKFWLQWDVDDLQCGFRCYNINSLKIILQYGLSKDKFDLETEILFVAWLKGIYITQIPIRTVYRKQGRRSRIIPLIDTLRWIKVGIKFGFTFEFFHQIWLTRRKIR
jgi:glycosyltransferase involved in cell wall biosynthesis